MISEQVEIGSVFQAKLQNLGPTESDTAMIDYKVIKKTKCFVTVVGPRGRMDRVKILKDYKNKPFIYCGPAKMYYAYLKGE